MERIMRFVLCAAVMASLLNVQSCSNSDTESNARREVVTLSSTCYKQGKYAGYYLVKAQGDEEWRLLLGWVDGLDNHEEGYEYILLVDVLSVEEARRSHTGNMIRLVKVISKEEKQSLLSEHPEILDRWPYESTMMTVD